MSDCRQIDSYPPDGRSGPPVPIKERDSSEPNWDRSLHTFFSEAYTIVWILFQIAITPCILEPLEAEDWALLLGARLAAALNLQVLNFLTDNEIH